MKRAVKFILKLIFYVTYPILIIALIIVSTILVVKMRELDSLNHTFSQATSELNEENTNKEITIEDLKKEFNNLSSEVLKLRSENAELKQVAEKSQAEGFGAISGRVFPVINSDGSGFSQYQKVCAELISNKNITTCRTVTAVQQSYSMSLPAGSYNVYAELYPKPDKSSPLANVKAYYSEYIKCTQAGEGTICDDKKLTAPVAVEVITAVTKTDVDPIDWR